jgi:hypothetical protein
MVNNFEILPHVGVGPLRFGMTPAEVAAQLGPPEISRRNMLKKLNESRGWIAAMYEKDTDRLKEVGFSRFFENLTYSGMNIFKDPDQTVLKRLCDEDGNPCQTLGFIVLLNLGITLTGFHDGNEDQKACTVFSKGTWEIEKDELKPFKLPGQKKR